MKLNLTRKDRFNRRITNSSQWYPIFQISEGASRKAFVLLIKAVRLQRHAPFIHWPFPFLLREGVALILQPRRNKHENEWMIRMTKKQKNRIWASKASLRSYLQTSWCLITNPHLLKKKTKNQKTWYLNFLFLNIFSTDSFNIINPTSLPLKCIFNQPLNYKLNDYT